MFKPSSYQEAIFDHIKNSNKNAVIEAVAGSGKTTTLVESLKICGTNDVIFVAFNKHIVDDLAPKVPKGVKVTTMHSFGYSQVKRAYPKIVLDKDKTRKTINSLISKLNIEYVNDKVNYITDLTTLVDLLRLNLCDNTDSAFTIIHKHSLLSSELLVADAFKVIEYMNRNRATLDFVDMIYIPSIEDIRINEFSLVLVDECQDLSKCQIKLITKMTKPNGRILAVGDRHQAIYGFGGADTESFDALCNLENTTLLPLSISYRCSKSVVDHAKKIVSNIESSDNAPLGKVSTNGNLSNVKDGDFILCRTNAPLVSLALQMISDGQKAVVKGVDIGKKLITNLKSTNRTDVKEAIKVLWSRYELLKQEMEGSFEMKSKLTLMNMEDMILATVSLAQGCKTIEDVHEKINKVFSDNTNAGIILSTAHKSKGLEANNIHIIKPQLMPLKHLDLAWEKIQEENLHYVAITRAKMNLFYIND
jgi:DNA helicase-2/ATP-dependent DNA helicase PcrA